jgi:diguanylate cyclase
LDDSINGRAFDDSVDDSAKEARNSSLKRIDWMLDLGKTMRLEAMGDNVTAPYGSLTALNSTGLIRSSISEVILREIAFDYLSLLQTSSAIYERNGDYALGIFSSGWCRFLDNASRSLCGTDDNAVALASGKWLCHECCWKNTSLKAIETRQPADVPCPGGLNLYALPIFANNEVVGAINFGYGDPPKDRKSIERIAKSYHVDPDKLLQLSNEFETRPPFIIEIAKERLKSSARLIGALVESKQLERDLRTERDRVQEYLDVAGVMMVGIDHNERVTLINKKGCQILGVTKEDVIGRNWFENFVPMTIREKLRQAFYQILQGAVDRFLTNEGRVINSNGQERLIGWNTAVIRDEMGNITNILSSGEDITERRLMEDMLYLEKEQLKTTLMSVGDGVISTDIDGRIMLMNHVSEQLTGWSQADAIGKPFKQVFSIIHEKSREEGHDPVSQVLKTGEPFEMDTDMVLIAKDGSEHPVEDTAAPIWDAQGKLCGVVIVFRDCTESRKKEEEISRLSYRDPLTGLHNRRSYEQELNRLDKNPYYPLTLIMGDVNGLKITNDVFGHSVGDELLQKVAEVLKRECRSNDIVARIGGDEFVILLPQIDAQHADLIVKRLNAAIKREKINDMVLSVSFGSAVKVDESEHIADIFNLAENDMYRNKISEGSHSRTLIVDLLLESLFRNNEWEKNHSAKVADISKRIAIAMGFSLTEANIIAKAGYLHDLGKIAMDMNVFTKPDSLTDTEWLEVKRHPEVGYTILNSVNKYAPLAEFVLCHHERWDGKGYPRGLEAEAIPVESRIITIADAFAAMTSERSYRAVRNNDEAIEELKNHAGTQFDPEIVKIFVKLIHDGALP